jgi:hypothetical protein
MESEYFFNTVRTRLTTTATKPCTFYGTDTENRRVMGKGPFPTKGDAEVAQKVSAVKSLLVPGIENPQIELVELIPDGMVDCQYGYRMSCDTDKPHWFQVVRGVMGDETTWPPPSKNISSPKAWPDPVKVVDWSVIKNYEQVKYNRVFSKSIYKRDPRTAYQFAANVFMSWVLGVGPTLSLPNFVIDKINGTAMQFDNDVWFNNDWWISQTRACSSRSKAYDQFKKFVNGYMGDFFDNLGEQFHINKKSIIDIVGVDNAIVMEQKIGALIANWEMAHKHWSSPPLPPSTPTKRSTPPRTLNAPVKKHKSGDNKGGDDDAIPEKVSLVRQQALPPVVERGCQAFTADHDIYIGESKSVYQHSTDPWGFSISVRENDMRKAIRRGDYRQAMVSFFVCYNLSRIFGSNDMDAKLIRTNILNRLVVCAVEDIGVANILLVNLVAKVINTLINSFKTNDNPNRHIKDFVERSLASIIYQMCISKKTRIHSYMYHAYHEKNAYMSINKFGIKWNYKPTSISDPNFIRVVHEDHVFAWKCFRGLIHESIYDTWKRLRGDNRNKVIIYVFTALYFSISGSVSKDELVSMNYSNIKIPERYKLNLYFENKIKEDPKKYAYEVDTTGNETEAEKAKIRRTACYIKNEDMRFDNNQFKKIYEISNV